MTTRNFVELTEYTCARCKVTKPIDQFYNRAQSSTKHDRSCKQCQQTRAKQTVDPKAVKAVKEKRDYYVKRELRSDGLTLVKFGNKKPAGAEAKLRNPPQRGIASSLLMFNLYE